MKRGDAAVFSLSAVLAVIVAIAVAYSLLVLDRRPTGPSAAAGDSTSSLLVLTWGPSLCTVAPSNPGCRSGHVGRLGETFVLHGLWPQPSSEQYCDVPKRVAARERTPVQLPSDLKNSLTAIMSDPVITTHEWYAHGTCSGVAPPEYFGFATTLTEQAGKVLDPLFDDASGRVLSARSLRETFDAQFGGGAGKRVGLSCRNAGNQGSVVYEVRLSLPPVVDLPATPGGVSLREVLAKGPAIPAGCGQGRVPGG
ncbi:MAG: ribonuclease T(2) [Actinomycetia bacterium]|nr:ribonuclease T(2) [Actinomycetes bacterium]